MATLQDSIAALTAQVAANTSAEKAALALINGFNTRLQAAIDAATAAGATAAQLQALNDLGAQITASDTELSAAVVANTPAA